MKKLLLISMLVGAMPLAMMAQDDDLYFVPKKKKVVEHTEKQYPLANDTLKNDVIDFTAEKGVYPDSVSEDFKITKQMMRFDDYRLADNEAFWAGYQAGRDTWGWYSPWYYNRYGWYGGWYDPWYYSSWRYGWYDPWYYGYAGWYDPWYYRYGYYGYYGWGYPYYHYPSYVIIGNTGSYKPHIGTGTIHRDGSTGGHYGGYRGAVAGNSSRVSSLRQRAEAMGGSRRGGSGNNIRSGSGNFSGYRGNSSNNSGSFSGSRSSSNSSYSGSRSSSSYSGGSRSSGGSFSGGGSRGGGGGGGRLGGRR